MKRNTKLLAYSALMCALIIVSTLWFKFSLPGTDVLVTTQVFFILLCGQLLPVRYCFYCIGTYLLIGLVGVPVFSVTAGPAVIALPTFGYLLGFPFMAAAVSALCRRFGGVRLVRYWASLVGVVVNYVVALAYIAALKGLYMGAPIGFGALLSAYCLAFLPLDILKALLAGLVGERLQKALRL